MNLKDYLLKLDWNSFERYPKQGENFYLLCTSEDGGVRRIFKISDFNAVSFNLQKILKDNQPNRKWLCSWLPA